MLSQAKRPPLPPRVFIPSQTHAEAHNEKQTAGLQQFPRLPDRPFPLHVVERSDENDPIQGIGRGLEFLKRHAEEAGILPFSGPLQSSGDGGGIRVDPQDLR